MAVVINEFEVMDTPTTAPVVSGDGETSKPAPPPLDPEDLRRMLAACAELQLRRLAH